MSRKWQGSPFSEPVNVLLAFPQRRGDYDQQKTSSWLGLASPIQDWAFSSCILKAREDTRQKSKHHKSNGLQHRLKKIGSAWRYFCLPSTGEPVGLLPKDEWSTTCRTARAFPARRSCSERTRLGKLCVHIYT